MSGFFADSVGLKMIIEKHGWTAYHINSLRGDSDSLWDELEQMEPAERFYVDNDRSNKDDKDKFDFDWGDQNTYILVKQPEKGQTIREACASTDYLGPALTMPNIEAHENVRGEGRLVISGLCTYLFTRLHFRPRGLVATSPPGLYLPKSPAIVIPYSHVLEVFERYFTIVAPEEIESSTISLALQNYHMPEDN